MAFKVNRQVVKVDRVDLVRKIYINRGDRNGIRRKNINKVSGNRIRIRRRIMSMDSWNDAGALHKPNCIFANWYKPWLRRKRSCGGRIPWSSSANILNCSCSWESRILLRLRVRRWTGPYAVLGINIERWRYLNGGSWHKSVTYDTSYIRTRLGMPIMMWLVQ